MKEKRVVFEVKISTQHVGDLNSFIKEVADEIRVHLHGTYFEQSEKATVKFAGYEYRD